MPSFEHQFFAELFRARPSLACELLALARGVEVAGRAEDGSVELSAVVSPEYRADRVVLLRGDDDRICGAIVIEIQLGRDAGKRWSWPVYVATLRAIHRCPVYLLVLAPDPAIAQWAEQAIALGHPGFELRPIVVSRRDIPRITDPAAARQAVELAVLSAIASGDLEVARAASAAMLAAQTPELTLYWDMILKALPEAASAILEAEMFEDYEWKSKVVRERIAREREQGLVQGLAAGRTEAMRDSVVELARSKVAGLDAAAEARIRAIEELAELRALFTALLAATPVEAAALLA